MTYSGILFDFDGVIADTEPIHWRCWADVLKQHGFGLDWPTYRRYCRGIAPRNMRAALRELAPMVDKIPDFEERYSAFKDQAFEHMRPTPPIPADTVTLLQSLCDFNLGLVTTAPRMVVEPVLASAGIGNVFRVAVFGEDVERHKPAPDAYLVAARRLGGGRILVFEDTEAGIQSARSAGLEVVRVEDCVTLAALVRSILGIDSRANAATDAHRGGARNE